MAQLRAETPPPRRRCLAETEGSERSAQQQIWSVKQGGNDWTESPLTRPRESEAAIGGKSDCLLPLKVNEDVCFSSPKPARARRSEVDLFPSPSPCGSEEKENLLPPQGLRATPTPSKTPSRLPTVQEHGAQGAMPALGENESDAEPAWIMQSPTPAVQDLEQEMQRLGMSPVPPGFEDVHCELPKPSVRSTFIQFVSPLKTFSLLSPPKTEPVNFAPSTSGDCSFFGGSFRDLFDENLAMSQSPSPWFDHEQIPFFPASSEAASQSAATETKEAEQAPEPKRGPVVRLAEFLPDPPSTAASWSPPVDTGFGYAMPGYSSFPSVPGSEAFAMSTGLEGMASAMQMDPMQGTQPWQMPLQDAASQMPPMQTDQASLQQMQMQLQQMQMQMQMQTQMQQFQPSMLQPAPSPFTQLPQAPPTMPPMQPAQQLQVLPQLQPPSQAPQFPQLQQPQMSPTDTNLYQLLQMQPQMQPPSWPPVPMASAGDHVPAPPQQAVEGAAPSALCPLACRQAQVCRCGEVKIGEGSLLPPASNFSSDHQQQPPSSTATGTCILLSAAMFPEMGAPASHANSGS